MVVKEALTRAHGIAEKDLCENPSRVEFECHLMMMVMTWMLIRKKKISGSKAANILKFSSWISQLRPLGVKEICVYSLQRIHTKFGFNGNGVETFEPPRPTATYAIG